MNFIIDRDEGTFAVLEGQDGKRLTVEKKKLPSGAKEGDVVIEKNNEFLLDQEQTQKRRMRIQKKLGDLFLMMGEALALPFPNPHFPFQKVQAGLPPPQLFSDQGFPQSQPDRGRQKGEPSGNRLKI